MKPKTDRGNIVRFCLLWTLFIAAGSAIASPKTLPHFPIWPTIDYGLGESLGKREIQKQGPRDELFLWRVDGEYSTVYLMGSIHILKQSNHPLAPMYEYAYDQCDRLVVEHHEPDQEKHRQNILDKVLLTGGKQLRHYISNSTYKWIEDFAIDNNIPKDYFNSFIPEYALMMILYTEAGNIGYKDYLGVDYHFIEKAEGRKPIHNLEGVERYNNIFSTPLSNQATGLEEVVAEIKKGNFEKSIRDLVEPWLNSDHKTFETAVAEMQKNDISEYNSSLRDRNIAWIPEIEKYIKQKGVTFVVAGTAHFFGEHSVLKLLAAKGHKIKQLYDIKIPKVSFSEAIKSDNLTAVKTYIQIHPNLNNYYYDAATPENSAYCPLHTAVKNGKFESVKLLVSSGANINRLTPTEATPILLAAQEGYLNILKYLHSQGGDVNKPVNNPGKSNDGRTPLQSAAIYANAACAEYLLAAGAQVDAKDSGNHTALMDAAWFDNFDIVKMLVENGAGIDRFNIAGNTALNYAIRMGYFDISDFLLENGANIDLASPNNGKTYLHFFYMQKETLKYLLSKGANINAKDNYGWTALHRAARYDYPDSVKILINQGAKTDLLSNSGDSALDLAIQENHTEIQKLLESGAFKISGFKYSGQFRFDINGMEGATFLIEASTDLKLWHPISEFKNSDGTVKFSDPTSPLSNQRFYRVKLVE